MIINDITKYRNIIDYSTFNDITFTFNYFNKYVCITTSLKDLISFISEKNKNMKCETIAFLTQKVFDKIKESKTSHLVNNYYYYNMFYNTIFFGNRITRLFTTVKFDKIPGIQVEPMMNFLDLVENKTKNYIYSGNFSTIYHKPILKNHITINENPEHAFGFKIEANLTQHFIDIFMLHSKLFLEIFGLSFQQFTQRFDIQPNTQLYNKLYLEYITTKLLN